MHSIGGPRAAAAVTAFLVRTEPQSQDFDGLSQVRQVAARAAAELDPDQDPEPILAVMSSFREHMAHVSASRPVRLFGLRRGFALGADPMYYLLLGVARLRRLNPVDHYSGMGQSDHWRVRAFACSALGDTADPRAVRPLEAALRDPHGHVRERAANGLRRLHNAGIDWAPESAAATLADGLADQNTPAALACTRALIRADRDDLVRSRLRDLTPRRQRHLTPTLYGEIPPLKPLWPGDTTV
ncbi:HEAT repeat domain-containing protein [Uniformispora flossi]|uniref:HEAT repeat domain-containing protein n=1 Tax=Uniformispora flossi TaxID=3390723 RepID=UPI003C306D09